MLPSPKSQEKVNGATPPVGMALKVVVPGDTAVTVKSTQKVGATQPRIWVAALEGCTVRVDVTRMIRIGREISFLVGYMFSRECGTIMSFHTAVRRWIGRLC